MPAGKPIDLAGVRRARAKLEQLVKEHPELTTAEGRSRLSRYLEDQTVSEKKREAEKRTNVVATRLTETELGRIQRLADALEAQTPGLGVSAGVAVRTAMPRGLALLEAELGLVKAKPKR